MYAVGVDVSRGKSTIAVLGPGKSVVIHPFDVQHTSQGLGELVQRLRALDGETRVVMEHTGRYYEAIAAFLHEAGFFVCAVNPLLIKTYNGASLRNKKNDRADAKKIARFALDNWHELRQYMPADTVRYALKTLNRQFHLAVKSRTACANNLISLLEQTYPGIRDNFESPVRPDGSQKWVDFAHAFWHVDCVRKLSLNAFTERYKRWCRRNDYNFSAQKAAQLHKTAQGLLPLVPMNDVAKLLVREAVSQLNTISHTVETFRAEMNRLAALLPEYEAVMSLYGVGPSMGPQLMAEIGDPRRFAHHKSLVAFAGIDPGDNQSGEKDVRSVRTSKRGSPYLRKTLFIIMSILLQLQPPDDPVYRFLDKKRGEGKPYHVYMTAGGTKFLRIYFGRIRDALREQGLWDDPLAPEVSPC